tara:strand:- start:135 stop:437 length:303 start_codon:yes stop_codon:yes gene_type:complete
MPSYKLKKVINDLATLFTEVVKEWHVKKMVIAILPTYINEADITYDIRLFDGNDIFIPRLQERDVTIIPKSILSGLSPKFINVSISGRIENPGTVKIPIE